MEIALKSIRSLIELIQVTDPALTMAAATAIALSLAAWALNWIRVSLALSLVCAAWILAMPGGLPLYKHLKEQRSHGQEKAELVSCIRHAGRDLEVWTGHKLPAQVESCRPPVQSS